MGSSAVNEWTRCVEVVEQLSAHRHDSDELPTSHSAGYAFVMTFTAKDTPLPSRSDWSKLMELEVPRKLSIAFVAAAADRYDRLSLAAVAALAALRAFVELVIKQQQQQQQQQQQEAHLSEVGGYPAVVSQLSQALWQQLEVAGLIQQLPAFMAALAPRVKELAWVTTHGSSLSSISTLMGLNSLASRVIDMLQLANSLQNLRPMGAVRLSVALALGPATMQLVWAVLQYVDMQCLALQQQQMQRHSRQQQEKDRQLLSALDCLCWGCYPVVLNTFTTLWQGGGSGGCWVNRPDAAPLLHAPHLALCLAFFTAVGVFASSCTWKQPAAQSSSSSSSSGGAEQGSTRGGLKPESSSSSGASQLVMSVWQQVTDNMFQQTCVTACHQTLFQALAVDTVTVLNAAGMLALTRSSTAGLMLEVVRSVSVDVLSSQAVSDSWRKKADSEQVFQQLQQLTLLVPTLWVQWVCDFTQARLYSEARKAGSGGLKPMALSVLQQVCDAAWVSCAGVLRWGVLSGFVAEDQQAPQPEPADNWSQRQLPREVAVELLPQLLCLLDMLLDQQQHHKQQRQHGQLQFAVAGLMSSLCLLLHYSQGARGAAAAASSLATPITAAASAANGSFWALLSERLQAIVETLEAAVRCLADPATSSEPSDVAVVAGSFFVFADADVERALRQLMGAVEYVVSLTRRFWLPATDGSKCAASERTLLQQLYSLLSSLLHLGSVQGSLFAAAGKTEYVGACLKTVAYAAVNIITNIQAGVMSTSRLYGNSSSSSSSGPTQEQLITAVLPSLPLCGRVCLQLAQHLHKLDASLAAPQHVLQLCSGMVPRLHSWLSTPSVAQQLSGLGYQPQELVGSVQQLQAVVDEITAAEGTSDTPQSLTSLARHLTTTGNGLCSVAVSTMCNYPACANVDGRSDIELVSGTSCVCGGCLTAHYCSRACQSAHWKTGHKQICGRLKVMAAVRAAASGGTAAAAAAAAVGAAAMAAATGKDGA